MLTVDKYSSSHYKEVADRPLRPVDNIMELLIIIKIQQLSALSVLAFQQPALTQLLIFISKKTSGIFAVWDS